MAFDKLDEYDIFGLKYNRERDPRAMGRMAAGMLVTRIQYPDMPRSRKNHSVQNRYVQMTGRKGAYKNGNAFLCRNVGLQDL